MYDNFLHTIRRPFLNLQNFMLSKIKFLLPIKFIFLLFFSSCKEGKEALFINKIALQKIGSKSFFLDSTTTFKFQVIEYLDKDHAMKIGLYDNDVICFFNNYTHTLQIYDYSTGQQVRKITFSKEGPNGIGDIYNFRSGFKIIGRDSILFYDKQTTKLSLCNFEGRILVSKQLSSDGDTGTALTSPEVGFNRPMIYYNNQVILNNYFANPFIMEYASMLKKKKDFTGLFLTINLKSWKKYFTGQLPSFFYEKYYGKLATGFTHVFDPQKNNIIYSFPIEDSVHIISLISNTKKEVYSGSYEFDRFKPLGKEKPLNKSFEEAQEIDLKNFLMQSTYEDIYCDPYSGYIIRAMRIGMTEDCYNDSNGKINYQGKMPGLKLIVLDQDFEKVGEFGFSHSDYGSVLFFSKEGINILKSANKTEDNLIFDVYKINNHGAK